MPCAGWGLRADMPGDVWNLVTFKALRNNKTQMTRMMEMSRIRLEQWPDKMTASFANAREDRRVEQREEGPSRNG